MLSNTDANQWKLEVERVTPSLKVHIRTDNKDWRTHVDQMHQHKEGIESALSETKVGQIFEGILCLNFINMAQSKKRS